MLQFLSLISISKNPTYRYFQIPEDFKVVDIHQPLVQDCFEFAKVQCPKFLEEFKNLRSLVLLHAWKKENFEGQWIAEEVIHSREKHLITVFIPGNQTEQKYIYGVGVMNAETPSGSYWKPPPEDALEDTMKNVKKQFGEDTSLFNVVYFKTVMRKDTFGYLAINIKTPQGIKLLDVRVVSEFGHEDFHFQSLKVVE